MAVGVVGGDDSGIAFVAVSVCVDEVFAPILQLLLLWELQ